MPAAGIHDRAIWVLGSTCPSRCVYCDIASQRGGSELSESEAVGIAEQLVDEGFRQVIFVGGEPLLFRGVEAVFETLYGRCEVAVFTGGIPGDAQRWLDIIDGRIDRLVLSIDEGDPAINDFIRGREGITESLWAFARRARAALPKLDISVSTVVSRHNVTSVGGVWEPMQALGLTAWVLVLAGDNFSGSPKGAFVSPGEARAFYRETVPELAKRVALHSPRTDFLVFPIPLAFLREGRPPGSWGDQFTDEEEGELEESFARYAEGDYNQAFVSRYGCPLVGRDITIGVGGEVYPCSQAPIIKPSFVVGDARMGGLSRSLRSEKMERFSGTVPHAPCDRCWAPSNTPRAILEKLLSIAPRSHE